MIGSRKRSVGGDSVLGGIAAKKGGISMNESKMKPILFNTEMVRAILDGRKTVTRRVIKPQPSEKNVCFRGFCISSTDKSLVGKASFGASEFDGYNTDYRKPPYQPGDILYVRETWALLNNNYEPDMSGTIFVYKADHLTGNDGPDVIKWNSPATMPREAARLFVKVTNIKAEQTSGSCEWVIESERCDKPNE